MNSIKRFFAVLLPLVLILEMGSILAMNTVSENSVSVYELYDYFTDINNCRKAGTPGNSDSPWSVQLKPYNQAWGNSANTYEYGTNDKYVYAYNADKAWGLYPGYSFYYPDEYVSGRLYLNTITPTNSAGVSDNSWTYNAAYTFTTPESGLYSLHPANQSLVYSFSDANYFHQWSRDEQLDFGIRITINESVIWPVSGEIRDGFGVFGTKDALNESIAVPTLDNIPLEYGDILRVEFTNFTPATVPWSQRICGTVAMSRTDNLQYGSYIQKDWNPEELSVNTSDVLQKVEKTTVLYSQENNSIITNNGSFGNNYELGFSITATEGLGNGIVIRLPKFNILLKDSGGLFTCNDFPFSGNIPYFPISSGKYDIRFKLCDLLSGETPVGTSVIVTVNGFESKFNVPITNVPQSGDFKLDNSTSGVAVSVTGFPIVFKENSSLKFNRNTNVIFLPETTTDNTFYDSLLYRDSVTFPDSFYTGAVVSTKYSGENFYISVQNDPSGDGITNVKDLIRAKKISAGYIDASPEEIYSVTHGKSEHISAEYLALFKKYLLTAEGSDEPMTIYTKASNSKLSANLLTSMQNNDSGCTTVTTKSHTGAQKQVRKMQNLTQGGGCGVQQVITSPAEGTYILSAYSKAENVTRTEDTEYYSYALMAQVQYSDGTSKDFNTMFSYGTHDWEYRETSFTLFKPADKITVYAFLRTPAIGTAYFDEISLVAGISDTVTFNNIPVEKAEYSNNSLSKASFSTTDGLKIALSDKGVNRVTVDGNDITSDAASGFMVTDIADDINTGVYAFDGTINKTGEYSAVQKELGLSVEAEYSSGEKSIDISGVLKNNNLNKESRAVRLSYALPVSGTGWRWATDILSNTEVRDDTKGCVYKSFGDGYMSVVDWDSDKRSYFPTAALYNDDLGIAISVSMDYPQYWELEYNATTKSYVLTLQLGITQEAVDAAKFSFSIYKLDQPKWGFRSAMAKYTEIHPDYYEVREKEHGLWLAWADVTGVSNVEDYNIKFKEVGEDYRITGSYETSKGIKGYHYIELGDWWIPNCESNETSDVLDRIKTVSQGDISERATMQAIATSNCQVKNYFGELTHNPVNNPWCPNGAQIHINANPAIPGQFNFLNLWYNESLKSIWFNRRQMTGTAVFDGIYLDELSGWWLGNANFNKEHYKYTTVPLTYSPYYKTAMLHRASTTWEAAKAISDDLHANGRTVFANKCPDKNAFYTPLIDAMGTEQTSLNGSTYNPQSIEALSTWRTLAYSKPFCILLSNDYDVFDNAMMENYFNRCLAYAIFPSPCANYSDGEQYFTSSKKYYERDRQIFKTYMPALKNVSEAGWQAVTGAYISDSSIVIERYGDYSKDGEVYFTVYNPTQTDKNLTVSIDSSLIGINPDCAATEVINNTSVNIINEKCNFSVPAGRTRVIHIK